VPGRGLAFLVLGYGVGERLEVLGVLVDVLPLGATDEHAGRDDEGRAADDGDLFVFLNRFFNLSATEVVSSSSEVVWLGMEAFARTDLPDRRSPDIAQSSSVGGMICVVRAVAVQDDRRLWLSPVAAAPFTSFPVQGFDGLQAAMIDELNESSGARCRSSLALTTCAFAKGDADRPHQP
jgi:hypothetical protein